MSIKRSSGILMPLFSLPSPYGIGDMGKAAFEFVDFLRDSGQSYWQLLPMGHIGEGASPYQSCASNAGEPLYIDLSELCSLGLLTEDELSSAETAADGSPVCYETVSASHMRLLRLAYERDNCDLTEFERVNPWVSDYALFMAIKANLGGAALFDWPTELRLRNADAMRKIGTELKDEINFYKYLQYVFFRQWDRLKRYAHENGILLIGDMPIYVAADSVDVWAEPQWFLLDEKGYPTEVSGVPPDCFSEEGQLWGNPLYDFEAMKRDGYGWWIRRIGAAKRMFDVLRIDHFRAFESFWAVPNDAATAVEGRWVKAPGMELVGTLTSWFSDMDFIAEDLGTITDEVRRLLHDSGLPGMEVLEFAFDGTQSAYLPHNHRENAVCYIGTHDNAPLSLWLKSEDKAVLSNAEAYLGGDLMTTMLRAGLSSVSKLFVAQMQDWLCIDDRTNIPGTVSGNWCWRLPEGSLTSELSEKICKYTKIYGR